MAFAAGAPPERDASVDALRGFALLGVILVNAPFFAYPIYQGPPVESVADQIAFGALAVFAVGKFFLIFSFLFGFGFATSIATDARAERASGPRFARRLTALFVFGMLHAVFFFVGDILMLYALLGVLLWLARGLSARTLFMLGGGVYALAVLAQALALTATTVEDGGAALRANAAYLGSFWDAVRFRAAEDIWGGQPFILVFNGPAALAMFLMGLALAKTGSFPGRPGHRASWRFTWMLLLMGATATVAALLLAASTDPNSPGGGDLRYFVAAAIASGAAPVLAASYGLIVMRAADRSPQALWVRCLASAGQMTLTGYLLHSVVLSFVFGGWGLALYGKAPVWQCLAIGAATYAGLVVLFLVWRRWFRYGPDEWAMRSWIDLKPKRFRR